MKIFRAALKAIVILIFLIGAAQAQQQKKLELVVQTGHGDAIRSVVFSPDGRFLATASIDKTVKIWTADTGQEIRTLSGHADWVNAAVFSPDGKFIASASRDKTVKLWNVETGQLLKTFAGHVDWVTSVAFSPDGKIIASASRDKTIKLWNVANGEEIKTLTGHSEPVWQVCFSPDGKTIASASEDKTARLWSVATGRELKTFAGHAEGLFTVAFSPDGKTLATGSHDKTVKLWNAATGRELKTLSGHTETVTSVAFSPDGVTLAGGALDKNIILWNVQSGQTAKTLPGAEYSMILSVAFSPDGKTIVAGTFDRLVQLREVATGREILTLRGHSTTVLSAVVSPDGRRLATGGYFGELRLWNIETGQAPTFMKADNNWLIQTLKFSFDGETLASNGNSPAFTKLWAVETGREIKFTSFPAWALGNEKNETINANGRRITAERDGAQIKFVDAETNRELARMIAIDQTDWVVYTTDGRFDATENAQKLLHYSYGTEIISLEQLKEMYYEPQLLQKILGFNREPLRPIVALSDAKLFPEVVAQSVAPNTTKLTIKLKNRGGGIGRVQIFVGNELGEKLAVEDARDEQLKRNPDAPEAILIVDLKGSNYLKGRENKITVVTSNYLKEIGKGNIQSRGTKIIWLAGGKEAEFQLPTLYAVVGGVSDYTGDALDLRFAAKDAEDFSNALSLGARKLFCAKENPNCLDKVNIKTLSTAREKADEQPTKENFKKAFADIAARAKPEDIVVIYLSGHGVSFGAGTDTYFYLTKDAESASREDLAKTFQTTAISSEELTDWLTTKEWTAGQKGIKPLKQVLILDTCASGNAAGQLALTQKRDLSGDQIRAVEFLKDKTGTFVLMASTADAPSYEASQFGQGLLTYSLLQAMKGAALDKSEFVDVQQLFSYAQTQVPRLAQNIGGVQRPIVSAPLGKTFVIGQMSDAEKQKIPLAAVKPLLLRPLLTNPETGDDDLHLISGLRKSLDAQSSYEVMQRSGKGAPVLVYVDDDNFPGAMRVTGTYTIEGETVKIKAFLRRDNKTVAALAEVSGAKSDVAALVNQIVAEILSNLKKL